jgi:hypothetical protein
MNQNGQYIPFDGTDNPGLGSRTSADYPCNVILDWTKCQNAKFGFFTGDGEVCLVSWRKTNNYQHIVMLPSAPPLLPRKNREYNVLYLQEDGNDRVHSYSLTTNQCQALTLGQIDDLNTIMKTEGLSFPEKGKNPIEITLQRNGQELFDKITSACGCVQDNTNDTRISARFLANWAANAASVKDYVRQQKTAVYTEIYTHPAKEAVLAIGIKSESIYNNIDIKENVRITAICERIKMERDLQTVNLPIFVLNANNDKPPIVYTFEEQKKDIQMYYNKCKGHYLTTGGDEIETHFHGVTLEELEKHFNIKCPSMTNTNNSRNQM